MKVYKKCANLEDLALKDFFKLLNIKMPRWLKPQKDVGVGKISNHINDIEKGDLLFLDGVYASENNKLQSLVNIAEERAAIVFSNSKLDGQYVLVNNVKELYIKALRLIRDFTDIKTVGITGSIGKTTATEIIYHVIASKYKTITNGSSANNHRLAGRTVQRLNKEYEVYVQEIMEGPPYGSASEISQFVKPDFAVVTLVSDAHIEHFGSRERIAESCFGIVDGMNDDGIVLINADDSYQKSINCKQKIYSYGINNNADIIAKNIGQNGKWIEFDICYENKVYPARLNSVGKHNVYYALAAFVIGLKLGMSYEEILNGIESYRPKGIRQNLVEVGGVLLYIDCYNCSTDSLYSSVKTLETLNPKEDGRRIVVFGDIAETGVNTVDSHQKVGEILKDSDTDIVFCYGKSSLISANCCANSKNKKVFYFEDRDELDKKISETVKPGDIILFKASHSMSLERTIDHVFGTHFRDEYDAYEFKTEYRETSNFKLRINNDNVVIGKYLDEQETIECPDIFEELPVVAVGNDAFSNNKHIKNVNLPKNLRSIRFAAFYNSTLESIILPNKVRILERSAFNSCKKLKEVVLNEGLADIGERAFWKCTDLKEIIIPKSVSQIANDAFFGCSENLVIGCYKDSYGHRYAKEKCLKYRLVDNDNFSNGNGRTTLLIIFGGVSSEHEVSRQSACAVLSNLNYEKYNVHVIGITKSGEWYLTTADKQEIMDGRWELHPENKKVIISPDSRTHGLIIFDKTGIVNKYIDIVWPVLHGKNGEDGTIQGLCELAGIKYVGPGVCSSAACMDKIITKMIVSHSDVKQAKYLCFNKQELIGKESLIADKIDSYFETYPLFVKPANAGSSVGISKVVHKDEIVDALHIALQEDDRILIEEGIIGQEVEVAVLGNDFPKASRVGEILSAADWYDYESKYINAESRTIIPANISEEIEKEIQENALEVYKIMGCKGLSRVDFFVKNNGEVIFNEINTLPGFTEISMYPKMWEATGIKYSDLLDKLIGYAE